MNEIFFWLGVFASAIVGYIYLDWGFLQLLGGALVVGFASMFDEEGPLWRQLLWPFLVLILMVLAHFWLDDRVVAWGSLLLSGVLFLFAFSLVNDMKTAKSGVGSVLTFMFLGVVFFTIAGIFLLVSGLNGLNIL